MMTSCRLLGSAVVLLALMGCDLYSQAQELSAEIKVTATKKIEKAVQSGDVCRLAAEHYEIRDIPDGDIVSMFEKAAADGDARATLWLARLFHRGRCGVPENVSKARQMAGEVMAQVQKQAEAGDREAQFLLGSACQEGLGVDRDFQKAVKWYEKAAASGHITALNNLGVMNATGHGTSPDIHKARSLYAQAAAKGSVMAARNLASFQDDNRDDTERLKSLMSWPVMQALGKQREDGIASLVKCGLLSTTKPDVEEVFNQDRISLHFKKDGMLLQVDISGRIVDVEGKGGGSEGFGRFEGDIPLGITWYDTAHTARKKLGDPDDSGHVYEDGAYGMAYRIENVFFAVMFHYDGKQTLRVWRVHEKWAADYSALLPAEP